jgi:PKD repeat protein
MRESRGLSDQDAFQSRSQSKQNEQASSNQVIHVVQNQYGTLSQTQTDTIASSASYKATSPERESKSFRPGPDNPGYGSYFYKDTF